MKVASREGFVPFDADADAVIPTYLLATATDLHPTYSMKMFMAVHPCGDSPPLPTRKECSEYRLCSIPAARKWAWRFEVICAGVSASFPLSPLSRTLGKKNPEPSASAQRQSHEHRASD